VKYKRRPTNSYTTKQKLYDGAIDAAAAAAVGVVVAVQTVPTVCTATEGAKCNCSAEDSFIQ